MGAKNLIIFFVSFGFHINICSFSFSDGFRKSGGQRKVSLLMESVLSSRAKQSIGLVKTIGLKAPGSQHHVIPFPL